MAEKATSSSQMSNACRDLKTALADKVSFPGEPTYKKACSHYWSKALRQMRPACVVSATTAQDVSAAIKALAQYPEVPFVVRSGGHDPNPGHASTDGGILISLTAMKGATYDKESGLALVKPGGQWNDVIKDLEPHGVTIVGGRLGASTPSQRSKPLLTSRRNRWCWRLPRAGRRILSLGTVWFGCRCEIVNPSLHRHAKLISNRMLSAGRSSRGMDLS